MPVLTWTAVRLPKSARSDGCRSCGRPKCRGVILSWYIALLVVPAALAQPVPQGNDPKSVRLRAFIEKYSIPTWQVDKNGVLPSVQGVLSRPLAGRSPVDVVYAFLDTNREIFGMSNSRNELKALGSGERDPSYHVRYLKVQQMYKGLEVERAIVLAHFNRQDILDRVGPGFRTGIDLPTTPVVSQDAALDIIAKDRARDVHALDVRKSELLVYPRDSTYYLAWHFIVVMGGEYFIDALTGKVIYHWDMIMR